MHKKETIQHLDFSPIIAIRQEVIQPAILLTSEILSKNSRQGGTQGRMEEVKKRTRKPQEKKKEKPRQNELVWPPLDRLFTV